MVHAFVQSRLDDVLRLAEAFGAPEMTVRREIAGRAVDVIGTSPIMGVVFTLVMLALVIGLSAFTYWAVELPGQRWAKARAERLA